MAGGIDWFRWHHGSVTDPKFQLVARKAGCRLSDVLAVWAFVLEKASAAEARGSFGELDLEAIDCLFGFDDGITASILEHMGARGLVHGGDVLSWEKRQPKREREDTGATERKRNQRERDAATQSQDEPSQATVSNVTPCHAMSRQEKPREEERREEKKEDKGESAVALRKPKASKKCPADFALTDEMLDWAAREADGVDARRETDKFRDYTFKVAHSDWPGAWRNWIRRAYESPQTRRTTGETDYQRNQRERMAELAPGVARRAPDQSRPLNVIDLEFPDVLAIARH